MKQILNKLAKQKSKLNIDVGKIYYIEKKHEENNENIEAIKRALRDRRNI